MFNNLNDYSNKELKEEFKNISASEMNEKSESADNLLDKSNKN